MISPEISKVLATMRSINSEIQPLPVSPTESQSKTDFSTVMSQAIDQVNQHQQLATKMVEDFQAGKGDANLAEVMIATQKASLSFQAMNEVRNRLVEAYQEIMNMPI